MPVAPGQLCLLQLQLAHAGRLQRCLQVCSDCQGTAYYDYVKWIPARIENSPLGVNCQRKAVDLSRLFLQRLSLQV